jgi:hypothetical protein
MSDLISREALLEELNKIKAGHIIKAYIINLITNAPAIEQGVAVGWCWYNKHTFAFTLGNYKPEYDTFPDNAIEIQPVYTQPQTVADALEEAANIKVTYTNSGRDDALTKILEDTIQEAVESAISQYKEAIRALITNPTQEAQYDDTVELQKLKRIARASSVIINDYWKYLSEESTKKELKEAYLDYIGYVGDLAFRTK